MSTTQIERNKKLDAVRSCLAVARHWRLEADVVLDALEYLQKNPDADLHNVLRMKSDAMTLVKTKSAIRCA